MKREVTATSYAIPITVEEYDTISNFERECYVEECLYTILEERTKAVRVDYGIDDYIYFTLDAEDDTPEEWDNIQHIITEHLRHATQFNIDFNKHND